MATRLVVDKWYFIYDAESRWYWNLEIFYVMFQLFLSVAEVNKRLKLYPMNEACFADTHVNTIQQTILLLSVLCKSAFYKYIHIAGVSNQSR